MYGSVLFKMQRQNNFVFFTANMESIVATTSSSITFKTSDKDPEKVETRQKKEKHVAEYLSQYRENKCTRILQGTDFKGAFPNSNGFVNTVVESYNHHHNLVIRPDDIWTAIIIQFSFYVNANAEEFRNKFVNFEGKKKLEIRVKGCLTSAPYDLCVKLMSEEIHKNLVDDEVKNWILPKFTTTTQDDYITNGVVFMATMKKYFSYQYTIFCGIPSVTLHGTVEDWQNLRNRLKKLNNYKLEKWVYLLEPIVDQFIRARSGDIDMDFWQKICHYSGGGSGPEYISGWITAFCVFNEEGEWQGYVLEDKTWPIIDTDDIPVGVVEVDILIDDNGTEYKSVMFAGHMGKAVLEDGCTLQPKSGWVIALKS
jgi:hypothetical protein